MQTKILIGIGCFLVVVPGFFLVDRFARSSWEIVNIPPKNDTIVAFGNSLVSGVGATKENDFVSLLGKKTGREIVNLGVPNDTTADGLRRIDEVLTRDPGVVIVLLGGNDALRKVPREGTRRNLAEIIVTLEENGSVVLLLGVRGGLLGDPFDEMYRELAEFYGTAYVPDVLEDILLKGELTEDQIHPNDEGYAIVAERVYKALRPLLGE